MNLNEQLRPKFRKYNAGRWIAREASGRWFLYPSKPNGKWMLGWLDRATLEVTTIDADVPWEESAFEVEAP